MTDAENLRLIAVNVHLLSRLNMSRGTTMPRQPCHLPSHLLLRGGTKVTRYLASRVSRDLVHSFGLLQSEKEVRPV
jgi:hypothetical protein